MPDTDATAADNAAFLKAVGQRLATLRKQAGLSQLQVGERVGVEAETISRMETGAIVPTLVRLRQLAAVYGCSLEEILGSASGQPGDVAKRLAQELATLSEADRLFVAQQTSQLISHIKFSRRRN
jgi:transcriptional regulator with XRE-family HTH domain